ncbi:MAG TPA: ATP-binding protein, partial [Acidimicrobiales bacterium]|nr:ATP-binding protein [Acidimicrobiales bacterium]
IDTDPAEAKRALEAISATSRTTLTEIRRLLGVLRDDEGEAAYAPAPGTDDLRALVAELTAAGVPTELHLHGETGDVPKGVELTAYRIVQEALTNVLKHGGPGASARVEVTFVPGAVDVEVADDGRGIDLSAAAAGGHGLVGMRERVGVYGGTLDAGPRPAGGFRVRAHLPYDAEAPVAAGVDP